MRKLTAGELERLARIGLALLTEPETLDEDDRAFAAIVLGEHVIEEHLRRSGRDGKRGPWLAELAEALMAEGFTRKQALLQVTAGTLASPGGRLYKRVARALDRRMATKAARNVARKKAATPGAK